MDSTAQFFLENKHLKIKVNASGAELCSVLSVQDHIEYIWQAEEDVWARHAPVLFPIVGRLKNNIYTYHEKTYALAQHGFARDEHFICVEQTPDTLVFELAANERTLLIFPFHFSLQIKYVLTEDRLKVSYQVFNPDNSDLCFSIGAHPGFNCPLTPGDTFEDYVIEFPNKETITCHQLSEGLLIDDTYTIPLQEHQLAVSSALFSNDALVLMGQQVNEINLFSKTSGHGVSLQCKDWPCFGIWSKKNTEKFICLEPWHGVTDTVHASGSLEDKASIIRLLPHNNFSCHYILRFF